jgi:excinuclease ABC subunit B
MALLEKQMFAYAKDMAFEEAAKLRDEILLLKEHLKRL